MKTKVSGKSKTRALFFSKRSFSFFLVLVMVLSIMPYAVFAAGETVTLRIEYIRKDASGNEILVARTYEAPYEDGEAYNVTSPAFAGYSPDKATVSGTMDIEDTRIINGVLAFTVEYEADQAAYQVVHRMQNLTGGYDDDAPITLYGATGTQTQATAKSPVPAGFVLVPFEQATIAASGTKVYINYNRTTQFVRYNTNGGSYIASEEYMFGQTVALTKVPTKAGYTFGGWFSDAALSTPAPSVVIGTEDITVYAKWISPGQTTYKVLFMTESTTVAGGYDVYGSKTIDATAGQSIAYNAGLHNPGFTGSDAAGFSFERADAQTSAAGDGSTVFHVYFTRNTFSIELQKQSSGSNYTYFKTITAKYGADVRSQWTAGDTQDYRWYTTKGGDVYYKDMSVMPAASFTLWGRSETGWITCTIYYQVEKLTGSGYDTHHTVTQSRWIIFGGKPSITVAEDCYAIPGFTYQRYDDFSWDWFTYNASIYYARNTYTINFDTRGGTPATIPPITAKFGATLGTVPTPTKEGYTFTGWYTDSSGEGTPVSLTTMPALPSGTTTLHAGWQKNSYTVEFNLNGAPGSIADGTALYNEPVSEPIAPTRTGYTFKGWYTTQTCDAGSRYDFNRPVTEDMELFCKWEGFEEVSYTVEHIMYDALGASSQYALPETRSANVGSTVTAYSAYNSDYPDYVADAPSKSLQLSATAGDNIITFTYRQYSDMSYTIIPTFNGVAIADVTPVTGSTDQARLFYTPAAISGYVAKNTRLVFELSPTVENIFYVPYYKALDASLIVVQDKQINYGEAAPAYTTNAWPFSEVAKEAVTLQLACAYTQGDDAGPYPITATLSPEIIGEYMFINTPTSGLLTVKKLTIPEEGDIAFAVRPVDTKVYDGTDLLPTITKQSGIATVTYSTDNVNFSATPIGVKNVADSPKTVYVKATPVDATNYEPMVKTVTLSITPKPLTILVDDITLEIGSPVPTLAVKDITGYVTGEDSLKAGHITFLGTLLSTTYTESSLVGTYPIVLLSNVFIGDYKVAMNANLASIFATLKQIPEEGDLAFSVADNAVTYDGAYHTVSVTNKNSYTLEYSLSATSGFAAYNEAVHGAKDVVEGTKTIYVRASKTDYKPKVLSATVKINPATLVATVQDENLAYGDSLPVFTVTDITGYIGSEEAALIDRHKAAVAGALSTPYTTTSSVAGAPYPVSLATDLAVGNYVFAAAELAQINLTNAQIPEEGELAFAVDDATQTYSGNAIGVAITNRNGYTLQYSLSGVAGTWQNEPITQTVVGSKTVYVKAAKENFTDKVLFAQVRVTPADLVVYVNNYAGSISEGAAVPSFIGLGYTARGFVNGENAGVISGVPVYGTNYSEGSPAGSYRITISGLSAQNYEISVVPGTLSVTAATTPPTPSPTTTPSPAPTTSPSPTVTPSPTTSPSPTASPTATQVIESDDTPLGPAPVIKKDEWALLTLVFAVATVLVMVFVLIGLFRRNGAYSTGLKLLSLLPAVAVVLITVLTQSFSGKMVLADIYTWMNAILLVAQITVTRFVRSRKGEDGNA